MYIKIEPRSIDQRGGIIMMPMKKNIPYPKDPSWKLVKCPNCGRACWDRQLPIGLTEEMFDGKLCTECAIKSSMNIH